MWIIDDDVEFEDVNDVVNYVFDKQWYVDNYDSDEVDNWINEGWYDQHVTIGGEEFSPAEIVKECNSSLYDEMIEEWAEGKAESDADYYGSDIENMSDGDYEYYNGYKVEYREEVDTEEQDEDEDEVNEFNAVLGITTHVTTVVRTVSDKTPAKVQVIS